MMRDGNPQRTDETSKLGVCKNKALGREVCRRFWFGVRCVSTGQKNGSTEINQSDRKDRRLLTTTVSPDAF